MSKKEFNEMAECQNVKTGEQTGEHPLTNGPTKHTDKTHGQIRTIFRVECNLNGGVLGHHVAKWTNDKVIISNYITLFLPRIWKTYTRLNSDKITFDDIFSHVMSHEMIHYLLFTHVGVKATGGFDKIKGQRDWFKHLELVGAGLPLDRSATGETLGEKPTKPCESNIKQDRQYSMED
jgi:hypothetical protein